MQIVPDPVLAQNLPKASRGERFWRSLPLLTRRIPKPSSCAIRKWFINLVHIASSEYLTCALWELNEGWRKELETGEAGEQGWAGVRLCNLAAQGALDSGSMPPTLLNPSDSDSQAQILELSCPLV